MKYHIYFSFELNNKIWNFDKIMFSNNIEKSISEYLIHKNLPLDIKNLKYKITCIKKISGTLN